MGQRTKERSSFLQEGKGRGGCCSLGPEKWDLLQEMFITSAQNDANSPSLRGKGFIPSSQRCLTSLFPLTKAVAVSMVRARKRAFFVLFCLLLPAPLSLQPPTSRLCLPYSPAYCRLLSRAMPIPPQAQPPPPWLLDPV